jgi:hypothetical protein
MAFNDAVRQRFRHAQQFLTIRSIFKARQGRLRSQILAVDGISTDQQLVDRIRCQPCRIVGVFLSQGNGHDSLRNQLTQLMLHLTRLPVISQTIRQCRCQAQPPLGGLEENCSAIGTALPLIKLRNHRSIKNIWKKETVCCDMFAQAKASLVIGKLREQQFFITKRLFASLNT